MVQDLLNLKMQALADPTRRAILARLSRGDATVNELAQPFSMSLPAVSRHIKVLEQAKLITRGRKAQQRPCLIAPDGLIDVDKWLQSYRALWEKRLDRLETYLGTIQHGEKK
jgi:DNA-binding transcriptional ArsR family regulator